LENINFELYKVFCSVAKNKNITQASHELFVSQPAITQAIKKLENQMGCKLFYRTKQGVELTDDGEILYDYIKIPVECLNTGKEKIMSSKNIVNKIRIGSGTTLIKTTLIGPLKTFKRLYPDALVEIKHEINKELTKMLSSDLLDIAVVNLPCDVNDKIVIEPIEKVEDIFVGKKEAFSKYQSKIFSMSELNDLPLVLQQGYSSTRHFIDSLCAKHHVELKPTYELASYGLVLDFVKEGLGIGFVNKKHIAKELKNGELFELKTNFTIPSREIGLAINKKALFKVMVNNFTDLLKKSKNK
jgi:DNA-binding transcriptional LysR family regulator